ncbi:MAG TPA: polysaccharide deacetylase family protein [Vicinamibacterales bacterium]|nr:polysaccharide deacetylase family protein [Vicinamibacterales bacterium]
MGTLRTIKLAALGTAESLGAFRLTARTRWRTERLLILCYHGVSLQDEHECSEEHVSVDHLQHRFEILRRERCAVLPLDEAVERLFASDLPPRSVALTFDDGLYDFKARAYPLLQRFGYPATVYVTSYYCRFPRPVFDVAAWYLLWKGRGRPLDTGPLTSEGGQVRVPDHRAGRTSLFRSIRAHLNARRLNGPQKDLLLRRLCEGLGFDWGAFLASRMYQLMTPEELRSLDAGLVDLQLHTHRHRTPRDQPLFLREVDDNIAELESVGRARSELRHFCYPSGDVDPMFFPWLRSRGVVTATTCDPQLASGRSDPLRLPRVIDTMETTDVEFRSWLSGLSGFVPQRGGA